MKRGAFLLAMLLSATLGVSAARAQGPVIFYLGSLGDTATGIASGSEAQIPVRSINPWYYYSYVYYSLTSARLTFVYDTAKVQVLGVQPGSSGLYNITSTVAGPGTFTVSATGDAYGYDAELYGLRVKLKPGVPDGSYLWIKSDSAALCYYSYYCSYYGTYWKPAVSRIGQVCHATQIWGDVDGNSRVDSRDALITLSAAVGLPVSGFNLPQGDVDQDGLTNSRDALFMLSYAIAVAAGASRVGAGIPDVCPGLTAPGDSVVFHRSDYPGLAYLGGASTTPAAISGATNAVGPGTPQLAHDGRSVVYMCNTNQICRVDAGTGGVVQLTSDGFTNFRPSWSPDGDSIVYVRSGTGIIKMRADGSGKVSVGGAGAIVVRWSPDGTKLAYANGSLHIVKTDGTNDVTVATGVTGSIVTVLWYPAGDSLAFEMSGDPRLWAVPVGGGSATVLEGFAGAVDPGSDMGPAGRIFSLDLQDGSPPSIWVVRGRSGPVFRVTRPTVADHAPAWRRNP